MAGQCHQSYEHESDPTPGGSGRQEGLACSGPWDHEESETTKRLNNNKGNISFNAKAMETLKMLCSHVSVSVDTEHL